MLGQLGQAGEGYSENMVPLGIGERAETGGARYFVSLHLFLALYWPELHS